jgi:hypothetical protein
VHSEQARERMRAIEKQQLHRTNVRFTEHSVSKGLLKPCWGCLGFRV